MKAGPILASMPAVSSPFLVNIPLSPKFYSNRLIAWKVHFDGYGKGTFEGERMPTKIMDLQQYYYLLQKRKNESDE